MEPQTPRPQGYDFFADVEGARSIAHTVEASVRFQTPLNALARLEQQLLELPGRLQYLNSRHVTYDISLGEAIGQLTQRLRTIAHDTRAMADHETQHLSPRVEQLWQTISDNDELIAADGYIPHANAIANVLQEADALKVRVERAEQDIQGSFNESSNEMRNLLKRITQLERVADDLKAAGWTLNSGELVRDSVNANYQRKPGDVYKGFLFLTTQRLLFERREEVTSGVLFLQRKKQVSEIAWESPLAAVTDVSMSGDSHTVRVSTAGQSLATFVVQGEADKWHTLLQAK